MKKFVFIAFFILCSQSLIASPLHKAIRFSWDGEASVKKKVKKLLVTGNHDPNERDDLAGETALHAVAGKGYLSVAKLLIKYGANVDAQDNIGGTPLHEAAENGHAKMAGFLISKGANINAKTTNMFEQNKTPLHYASHGCKLGVVRLLVKKKADLSIVNGKGKTALEIAKERTCSPKLIWLLKEKPKEKAKTKPKK